MAHQPTADGDPLLTERELASTFDGGYYVDAWAAVEEYRRVMSYASRHPNRGSQAIASRLEIPRSRIRPWLDGGVPDPVRAIDTAREHGWLALGPTDEAFAPLNVLVANVFAGGSVTKQTYQPMFALASADASVIDALEASGAGATIVADREERADEARPSEDGSILGRVLACLGAPVGVKADQRLTLPAYLDDAPTDVRAAFVDAYLENRVIEHEGKDTLTILEERNRAYLRSLAELIDDVVDGRVELGDRTIVISAEAARRFEISG